jgi:hypothetical protein
LVVVSLSVVMGAVPLPALAADQGSLEVGTTVTTTDDAVDPADGPEAPAEGEEAPNGAANSTGEPGAATSAGDVGSRDVDWDAAEVGLPVVAGGTEVVAWPSADEVATSSVGDPAREIEVYIRLTEPDPAHEVALERLGAEVTLRSAVHVSAIATPAVFEQLRAAPFVEYVGPLPLLTPPPQPIRTADVADLGGVSVTSVGTLVSEGVADIGADRLHAEGVTGTGVKVGIIDGDFDPTNPEVAPNLVAYRSFAFGQEVGWEPPTATTENHGTAVAEVVLDVAPDAQLSFAHARDIVSWHAAMTWLLEDQDVDGDGQFTFIDVIGAVFAHQASDRINADPAMRDALNFDGQGQFTFVDVIDLVFRLST